MPDVPFLCDFPRAVRIAIRDPSPEIARYLKIHRDHVYQVFATLSYFDGTVLGRRATALFSVARMDEICPPSTVYAAFHAFGGRRRSGSTRSTTTRGARSSRKRNSWPGSRRTCAAHLRRCEASSPFGILGGMPPSIRWQGGPGHRGRQRHWCRDREAAGWRTRAPAWP